MSPDIEKLLNLVDQNARELTQFHQELVRTPTVNTGDPDSGNEAALCVLLQEKLSAEGISSQTYESHPGRANLIASIGPGSGERLLLMSHTDVVPVEQESAWSFPPFDGVIDKGRVYGRGSGDAKSLVSTGLMTLVLLKRAGIALNGDVRFLAAADEESGGSYGIAWMAHNHPDELRATWALNEGGGTPLQQDSRLGYLLTSGEKGRLEAQFTCNGQGGHAARPWASDNPLLLLGRLLRRIEDYRPEVDVTHPVFKRLDWYGVQREVTADNLDTVLQEEQVSPAMVTMLKALSRMSIAPTLASAGLKSNSIPASARLTCDIRALPWQDDAYVHEEIRKITQDLPDVSYDLVRTAESNDSPVDTPFVDTLQQALRIALDQEHVELVPALTVGFTDSRYVRPLGTDVYGFSPLIPDAQLNNRGVHGVDEYFEIDSLLLRVKFNMILAYLLLSEGAH